MSDADDADAELTLRLKAGDERALQALMLRHGGRLRLIARRILARADEAEDIVQDVFLAVWRRADRLDTERGPIGAYLTRAVVNRSIDRARRARFLQFIGLDTAPEGVDDMPGPEVTALARSEVSAVMRDLQTLPPRQRAAILLASSDEHSTVAIADLMNLSVGATEQLLVRARRTLRLRAMARQSNERAGEP
ncbi:RNA polymerase sigma factor [Kaistia soli]|uniref:RNA polymerase sigma factor n=1 Tax=Kaistia soli TaxID=446684 RepID=UPI001AECFDCA|nr:sigma-70 family RNA polymerase sigma factor [Kaistia soli]